MSGDHRAEVGRRGEPSVILATVEVTGLAVHGDPRRSGFDAMLLVGQRLTEVFLPSTIDSEDALAKLEINGLLGHDSFLRTLLGFFIERENPARRSATRTTRTALAVLFTGTNSLLCSRSIVLAGGTRLRPTDWLFWSARPAP